MVWHTSPAKTLNELFVNEVIVGGLALGTPIVDFPLVTNAILGTGFTLVTGYEGLPKIDLAMEAGEIHGNSAVGWFTAKMQNPAWIKDGKVLLLAQYGTKKHPDLANVPLFETKSTADAQAMALLYARQDYGQPFFTTPDVPADRLKALREAFHATLRDSEFLADAEKVQMPIDPVSGEELDALTQQITATSPDITERVRKILSPDGK